jgi:hypothetical protein
LYSASTVGCGRAGSPFSVVRAAAATAVLNRRVPEQEQREVVIRLEAPLELRDGVVDRSLTYDM